MRPYAVYVVCDDFHLSSSGMVISPISEQFMLSLTSWVESLWAEQEHELRYGCFRSAVISAYHSGF